MPEMPEGEFPGKTDGEMPEMPEGGFPGKPEGEMPERPEGKGKGESVTFTITDATELTIQAESGTAEATIDQITTESMLQVELNENMEARSVIIFSIPATR